MALICAAPMKAHKETLNSVLRIRFALSSEILTVLMVFLDLKPQKKQEVQMPKK